MDIRHFMTDFGFGHQETKHLIVEQDGKLWLTLASDGMGMFMMATAAGEKGLFEIDLIHDGESIDYAYTATPYSIKISSDKGNVKLAIDASKRAIRIVSDSKDLDLKFDAKSEVSGITSRNTAKGSRISIGGGHYYFIAKTGTISFDDTWIRNKFHSITPVVNVASDAEEIELLVFEVEAEEEPNEDVLSIEACEKAAKASLKSYAEKLVSVPDKYNNLREEVSYLMWLNHRKRPDGSKIILENTLLSANSHPFLQAVASLAFANAADAISLISSMGWQGVPIQGLATHRIFKRGNFKFVSRGEVYKLFDLLRSQVGWWTRHRSLGGLLYYAYRTEPQMKTKSLFSVGEPVFSPDINTYISAAFKAMSLISGHFQNSADEQTYEDFASRQEKQMLLALWDDSEFYVENIYTAQTVAPDLIIKLMPLALGEALPGEVSKRLAAQIDNDILNAVHGAFVILGLNDCGEEEIASKLVEGKLEEAKEKGINCPIHGALLLTLIHDVLKEEGK